MENTKKHPVIHLLFVALMLMVSIGASADWRISHVAPGQDLGTYAPQRMILTDPESGEMHVFFYGHAVTHAIIDGDDVEWDIVDPRAQGRGPISAAWTPDGRLGVAWGDVITRRIFLAVQDEFGGWGRRDVDDAFPMSWGRASIALAFDESESAIVGTRGYDQAAREEIVRVIRASDAPTTLFETTDHGGVAELLRGADDVVWYFYSTFDDGGLGTIDADSGVVWDEWTPWDLTPSGDLVEPGVALWPIDNGIAGAIVGSKFYSGYKDSYEDYECAMVRNFTSDLPGQYRELPLPFDLPQEIDAVAGWGREGGELTLAMGNGGRLVFADYDAAGTLSPGSTVLEVNGAHDTYASGTDLLRLDAVKDVDGRPLAAIIADGRLELVSRVEDDWMRRVLAESTITHDPTLWVDTSEPEPVVEILSFSFTDEPRLRLDRFDSTWMTRIWPLPVSPDQYEDSVELTAARADDGTWYALIEYHLYPGWRVGAFRLVDDEWHAVELPVALESSYLPRMRRGADGGIYIGAQSLGGYQVLRLSDEEWEAFDSATQFPLTFTEHGDFDVDANGDFHVLVTTSLVSGLRYFRYESGTGNWVRENVPNPQSRCALTSQVRIVPADDGSTVTGMCLNRWDYSADQGKLTTYVRTDAGNWNAIPVFDGLWSDPDWGIDGVWAGDKAKFVISHEGNMNVIQVDGLFVESDPVDGAVGGGAIDLVIAESGEEYLAYDSAAGVAIAYPSDFGDALERPWTPDTPAPARPMTELPLQRGDPRCSDLADDDTDDDDTDDDTLDDDGSPIDDDAGSTDDDAEMDHAHHGDSDSDDSSWCG